jgi:hypothetical protein
MRKVKMGGRPVLRVFLKGDDDLQRALLEPGAGPPRLRAGLRDLLRERGRGAELELRQEPGATAAELLEEAEGRRECALWSGGPCDVAAFSLQPEALRPGGGPARFKADFRRVIRAAKERLDAHLLVFNCSSLDPDDDVHNYHGREDTLALRIHKLNLALMELSVEEGISIVDVDRQVAEMGGQRHVLAPCRYSEEAYEAVGREFLRVLEDIGFFEARPLVLQVGQGGN